MKKLEGYRNILKEKEFCKLMAANAVNRFGDSIDAIALSWLIYQVSQEPSLSALNFGINFLPTIFLQPIAGAFVQRHNKQHIMILSDLGRGLVISLMGILFLTKNLSAWTILISTILLSILEAFRLPCGNALVPQLIHDEHIEYGLSLSASLNSIMEIIGTACASIIISIGGVSFALFSDAITFYISAFLIGRIYLPKQFNQTTSQQTTLKLLKEGFCYLLKSKTILIIILIATCLNALLVPYNALQSVLCIEIYQMGAEVLSIQGLSITFGLLIGSFITPFISKKLKGNQLFLIAFFCFSGFYIFLILIALFKHQPFFFYLAMILTCCSFGIFVAFCSTTVNVLVIKKIEPAYLSRITAVNSALSVTAIPIVSFIISGCTKLFSIDVIFISFGILTLILGFIFGLSPIFKQFNQD